MDTTIMLLLAMEMLGNNKRSGWETAIMLLLMGGGILGSILTPITNGLGLTGPLSTFNGLQDLLGPGVGVGAGSGASVIFNPQPYTPVTPFPASNILAGQTSLIAGAMSNIQTGSPYSVGSPENVPAGVNLVHDNPGLPGANTGWNYWANS